jgi:serine/threonine-protein kinase
MRSQDDARYRILGEIARGGVGVVLKSHDGDLGRHVAMKVLLDQHLDNAVVVERFVEEAQIDGQLQHPGIVPVYELGMGPDQRPFFTMKLVKGRTLSALFKERKPDDGSRRRFLSIFEMICQTMAYAHSRGVVHRDLKPSNVMVGAFGEVQVVDWGLAKVLVQGGVADEEPARKTPQQTEISIIETFRSKPGSTGTESVAGSVMGTPAYMAPEQAMGQVESVDERADVFALGAILLEMITGRAPYLGTNEEVILAAANARLDPAFEALQESGADAELVEICRTCLAPSLSVRFRNGQVVADRIGSYVASVEERAREAQVAAAEARVKAADERKARKLTLALGASVVLTLLVGGAGYRFVELQQVEQLQANQAAVNRALDEAQKLRASARAGGPGEVAAWDSAIQAARRAEQVVQTGEVDDETRTRVATVLADLQGERQLASFRVSDRQDDLDFLQRFAAIRSLHGFEETQRWERIEERYEEAFFQYGIEVEDPKDAVDLIHDSDIPLEFAAALDDWAWVDRRISGLESERAMQLLGIALAADLDPWRQRLRQAMLDRDLPDLRELAQSPQATTSSAEILTTLAKALWEQDDVPACVETLRTAKQRFPTDFVVNLHLAQALSFQGRPAADVLRYAEVALSSEPKSVEA